MAVSNILHLIHIKSWFIFVHFLSLKSLIKLLIEQTFERLLSEVPDLLTSPVRLSAV